MFLNIDRKEKTNLALIDNEGNRITYGELAVLMDTIGEKVQPRSLVFQLCKNTAGSVAGYLGFIEHEAVPVTLNSKIDPELLGNLLDIYTPAYIWCPVEETERFGYEKVFETLGYALLKTGNDIYPLNDMLQLCMTTSGSTGSPKLVRYKKGC